MINVEVSVIRTLVLYFVVLTVFRVMGKRELGQLAAFDLVVVMMIGAISAFPLEQANVSVWHAVVPILIITTLEVAISWLSLKNKLFRKVIEGSPTIVIRNGQVLDHEMRKIRCTLNDLLRQLREKDVVSLNEVEYAIMETNGNLTVIKKSQFRSVTPADLGLDTGYEGLASVLIADGEINYHNLRGCATTLDWLQRELKKRQITDVRQVMLASLDTQGNLYVSPKTDPPQTSVDNDCPSV